jgi:hypothetical protein
MGIKYYDAARACVIKFPPNDPMRNRPSWFEFCQWAYENGYLDREPLPEDYPSKQDDAWQGYEHRRSKLIDGMNTAACRNDMPTPFRLKRDRRCILVRSLEEEIMHHQIPKAVTTFTKTKVDRLEKLSSAIEELSPLLEDTLTDMKWFRRFTRTMQIALDEEHDNRLKKIRKRI